MSTVSVILPTYARNADGMLANAICSVLAQSMPDLELLVVDDGSSDGSSSTIQEFAARDRRVRHIRFERNVGLPALTTAEAFIQSTGQFVAWQFDDCTWEPHHLATLLSAFDGQPEAGIAYGQVVIDTDGSDRLFGDPFDAAKLKHSNFIPNCSVLVRRSVYESTGWIDPSIILKRVNDYDMWLRASRDHRFVFVPVALARERGQALTDSLGNSVSLADGLTQRYMAKDRNAYLRPANMAAWQPFTPPDWLNTDDKEEFAMLAFEHFLRIGQLPEAVEALQSLLPELTLHAGPTENSPTGAAIRWYFMKKQEAARVRKKQVDDYLQEQLKYIAGQHAHIEAQAKEIASRDQMIQARDRLLHSIAQHGFLLRVFNFLGIDTKEIQRFGRSHNGTEREGPKNL